MTTDLRAVGFSEVRERLVGNRLAVYAALLDNGPCTGTELAVRMNWTVLSVRPRVSELEAAFHVVPTGRRRNGEHEFRALPVSEAQTAHASARQTFLALENNKPAPVSVAVAPVEPAMAGGQGSLFV